MAAHIGMLLVALAAITLSFLPSFMEARAGRTARLWAIAGFCGPYVFLVWLFTRHQARRQAQPGGDVFVSAGVDLDPPQFLLPWWSRLGPGRQSSSAGRLMRRPDDRL